MHEAPIALLIPPDLPPPAPGRTLPTPVLAQRAEPDPTATNLGPILFGVGALDGSGRVRERTLLAALGWGHGQCLEISVFPNAALLRGAPQGPVCVDARDQIALSSGCRDVLGVEPGARVVLAALPLLGVLLVCPMLVAASWMRPHIAKIREIFDD